MGRVNTLRIADRIYLLVHGTGGTAHLAAEQVPGGRAAFLDDDFESASRRGWDGEDVALREPRWSPKSLCGNQWACMSPTEETRSFFHWDVEEVFAPGRARGFRCRSLVKNDAVVIYSDDAYDAIPRETKLSRLRQILGADGETSLSQPAPSRLEDYPHWRDTESVQEWVRASRRGDLTADDVPAR